MTSKKLYRQQLEAERLKSSKQTRELDERLEQSSKSQHEMEIDAVRYEERAKALAIELQQVKQKAQLAERLQRCGCLCNEKNEHRGSAATRLVRAHVALDAMLIPVLFRKRRWCRSIRNPSPLDCERAEWALRYAHHHHHHHHHHRRLEPQGHLGAME